MTREQKAVRALFQKLKRQRVQPFPKAGKRLDVPNEQGVYVIYAPHTSEVLHVGRTYRGTAGLRQRLKNHLHGQSSFTIRHLKGRGSKLRKGYKFRCIPVTSARRRALLEGFATGCLCPRHLGTSAGDE